LTARAGDAATQDDLVRHLPELFDGHSSAWRVTINFRDSP